MAANNLSILIFIPFSSPPSMQNHGWPGWPIEHSRIECMWSSKHFSFRALLLWMTLCGGWRKPSTRLWGRSDYTVERPWWRGAGAIHQQPGLTHPQRESVTLEAGSPIITAPSKGLQPWLTSSDWNLTRETVELFPAIPNFLGPQKSGETRNNFVGLQAVGEGG